jgi:hypothetical protein
LNYQTIIENKARKEAEKIPLKHRAVIDKKILSLGLNPRPQSSKSLLKKKGTESGQAIIGSFIPLMIK